MRSQIRAYLTEKLRATFPDWDFSSHYIDPRQVPKLNIFFPREQFHKFAEGPRVYERELLCELELVAPLPREQPYFVEELTEKLAHWLEKERFLNRLVLDSQILEIESGEEVMAERSLGFVLIRIKYNFQNSLLRGDA